MTRATPLPPRPTVRPSTRRFPTALPNDSDLIEREDDGIDDTELVARAEDRAEDAPIPSRQLTRLHRLRAHGLCTDCRGPVDERPDGGQYWRCRACRLLANARRMTDGASAARGEVACR